MSRHLHLYLFASVLAFAVVAAQTQPSFARIVYTSTNQTISGPDVSLPIDLDHDGIVDVTIFQNMAKRGCYYDAVDATPSTGNAIVSNFQGDDGYWASALNAGQIIGLVSPYAQGDATMTYTSGGFGCPFSDFGYWGDGGVHYLGIAFVKNGGVHYAWAQLQVTSFNFPHARSLTTTLTGYAYQTIVGRQIPAGRT